LEFFFWLKNSNITFYVDNIELIRFFIEKKHLDKKTNSKTI